MGEFASTSLCLNSPECSKDVGASTLTFRDTAVLFVLCSRASFPVSQARTLLVSRPIWVVWAPMDDSHLVRHRPGGGHHGGPTFEVCVILGPAGDAIDVKAEDDIDKILKSVDPATPLGTKVHTCLASHISSQDVSCSLSYVRGFWLSLFSVSLSRLLRLSWRENPMTMQKHRSRCMSASLLYCTSTISTLSR